MLLTAIVNRFGDKMLPCGMDPFLLWIKTLKDTHFQPNQKLNQCWFNAVPAAQLNGSRKHDTGESDDGI